MVVKFGWQETLVYGSSDRWTEGFTSPDDWSLEIWLTNLTVGRRTMTYKIDSRCLRKAWTYPSANELVINWKKKEIYKMSTISIKECDLFESINKLRNNCSEYKLNGQMFGFEKPNIGTWEYSKRGSISSWIEE